MGLSPIMKLKFTPQHITILAAALIGAGVTLFTAAAVQQNYRLSANDPQIQLAEDAAAGLSKGLQPEAVVGSQKVDASASLAPFVTVYSGGKPYQALATSGYFTDNKILAPPPGAFDTARATGEDRFTWQTLEGQREAAVLVYADSPQPAYVLAARNLREVESREQSLRAMSTATLTGIIIVALAAAYLLSMPDNNYIDNLRSKLKKAFAKP